MISAPSEMSPHLTSVTRPAYDAAEDDLLLGYKDGHSADTTAPGPNRSLDYRLGWWIGFRESKCGVSPEVSSDPGSEAIGMPCSFANAPVA